VSRSMLSAHFRVPFTNGIPISRAMFMHGSDRPWPTMSVQMYTRSIPFGRLGGGRFLVQLRCV
jgi:hypothetical protein